MKLQSLAIGILPYVSALRGELLSSSLPNSVCDRKKTSLTGWLPLPQTQLVWPSHLFSSPGRTFTPLSHLLIHYSNSK